MAEPASRWVLLVYKIPSQPTRLRLSIWRRLQKMGVVYLQDAVCLLPSRPDLVENMHYIAEAIEAMGGSCHLFLASPLLPHGTETLMAEFRALADSRLEEIAERLDRLQATVGDASAPDTLEGAEEDLKRERVAFLRTRKLAYCGSTRDGEVDERLDRVKRTLDDLYRNGK